MANLFVAAPFGKAFSTSDRSPWLNMFITTRITAMKAIILSIIIVERTALTFAWRRFRSRAHKPAAPVIRAYPKKVC